MSSGSSSSYCLCCSNCLCSRPLGTTLRLVWSSGNGGGGEFFLYYGMQTENEEVSCTPFTPGPFPGYKGSETRSWPLPMGGSRADTLEVIIPCNCIDCPNCIYYRWSGDFEPVTWHVTYYEIVTCDCPAILEAPGFSNDWGYQVNSVLIYELESNCL